mmetsp:Transcript_118374/g.339775  ORF Transcript_118374/g.339775 Transcript_118374/m.339775 type:complete len:436 (+) Transcript_118374:101-1408(+)
MTRLQATATQPAMAPPAAPMELAVSYPVAPLHLTSVVHIAHVHRSESSEGARNLNGILPDDADALASRWPSRLLADHAHDAAATRGAQPSTMVAHRVARCAPVVGAEGATSATKSPRPSAKHASISSFDGLGSCTRQCAAASLPVQVTVADGSLVSVTHVIDQQPLACAAFGSGAFDSERRAPSSHANQGPTLTVGSGHDGQTHARVQWFFRHSHGKVIQETPSRNRQQQRDTSTADDCVEQYRSRWLGPPMRRARTALGIEGFRRETRSDEIEERACDKDPSKLVAGSANRLPRSSADDWVMSSVHDARALVRADLVRLTDALLAADEALRGMEVHLVDLESHMRRTQVANAKKLALVRTPRAHNYCCATASERLAAIREQESDEEVQSGHDGEKATSTCDEAQRLAALARAVLQEAAALRLVMARRKACAHQC